MTKPDYPLTKTEFDTIYAKVPRLTVEIILKNGDGAIYLTKRAIEPCAGQWHLPGGTVFFGESLVDAVKRVGQRELGIKISATRQNGYIEYPSHYRHGLDCPVGIVFEVIDYTGIPAVNQEASGGNWFTRLPDSTHGDQDTFLVERGYLQA